MRFDVRCLHLDNSEHVDRHAREKLIAALDHFAHRVERVDVLLEDMHGTKHGIERRCVVRVRIHGASEAVVQHVDPDIYHAIDEAAKRVKRTVRRRINRRRDIAHHRSHGTRAAA
ncbi:MAG: HPF/RaiA family ribosome-associated protein [Phycisphaeraceae bacterium]